MGREFNIKRKEKGLYISQADFHNAFMDTVSFHGYTRRDLGRLLSQWGAPRYAGEQVFRWLWARRVFDFETMTDLSLPLRRVLKEKSAPFRLERERRVDCRDGTRKYLWKIPPAQPQDDTLFVESVLIPMGKDPARPHHFTACLSTQAGCRMKCRFCATGVPRFQRHLTAAEIVEQFLQMEQDAGVRFHNVVFMGMGEPLDNYEATQAAVRILNDPHGCAIGRRRLTVSTVGLLEPLKRFIKDNWPCSLALSLHAAQEDLRRRLVPPAAKNPLKNLKKLLKEFTFTRRLPVTLEYVLLAGVNDREEDIEALATFCNGLLAKINLIRYNPVPGLPFECPSEADVLRFQKKLREKGLRVMLRERKGVEIAAACGQLGLVDANAALPAPR